MKPKPPSEEALEKLLREWRVEPEEAPRFEEDVWRRIAAEESASPGTRAAGGWLAGVLDFLRGQRLNPAWGLAVVLVSLGVGAGFGHRAAATAREAEWSRLGQRYANSINPLVMAATRHPALAEAEVDRGAR
jgi:hypothetical protein